MVREETLLEKVIIGILFIAFTAFWVWFPDFLLTEEECKQQTPHAITSVLCNEPKAK